jgi:adenosylhomocysteine nucleosidase
MGCNTPGFVTGIDREAALIPSPYLVLCSGADPKIAERAARQLADQGCDLLVSFGLAGGLAPGLAAGALLAPKEVIAPDGQRFATADGYPFANAMTEPLAGSDVVLATPQDKEALFARTKAIAVDMESHAVARVAQERGLPFLVLRAVADTFDMALPNFIAQSTAPDGSTRLLSILSGLLRHPAALPDLLRLAKASNKAFAALKMALAQFLKK